jgi:peptide-methionine (S)-S-oxide reductase
VIRTRVGYAGGDSVNPTYHDLDGHSETIQVEYDPTRISYEELLGVFWDSHNPTTPSLSRQYMSIIFYHNEEQRALAVESKQLQEQKLGRSVATEIVPFSGFYPAEDYHQKYYLSLQTSLMKELREIYPDFFDFVCSTTVARLNGYAGGYGTREALEEILNDSGLSEAGRARLLQLAARGLAAGCPLS